MTQTILSNEQAQILQDAAEAACWDDEGRIYIGYSGRGMYGDECVGVTLDSMSRLYAFALEFASRDAELADLMGSPRTDDLGLGMIAYWPRYHTEDGCEDELF